MFELKTVTIALLVIAVLGGAINYAWRVSNSNRADVVYGNQAGSIDLNVRSFTMANRASIIAAVTANGGNAVAYTVANAAGTAQLQAAGAIDPSVNGLTPTGGQYCLAYRTYNGGANLQGLLTVVGETIPKTSADASAVASAAGTSFTGYISGGNVIYPGGTQPLSAFTGAQACNPGPNAFAALITDGDTIGTATWLCRTPYPNNNSCSTMAQNLGLGGNSITGILNETGTGASQFSTYTATTSVTAPIVIETSDRTLKKNPKRILDPWKILEPINGYTWEDGPAGRPGAGVLAQEVQISLPQLVSRNAQGKLQVAYSGLSGGVIEGTKDNHRHILRLDKAENDNAQRILRLEEEVATLRAAGPVKAEAGR